MRGEGGHILGIGKLVNMKYHLKPRYCDLESIAAENVVLVQIREMDE